MISSSLSEFQLNEFKEAFWLLDRENTGKITCTSLVNHFRQLGHIFTEEQIQEVFSFYGVKEGIDLIEFMAIITNKYIPDDQYNLLETIYDSISQPSENNLNADNVLSQNIIATLGVKELDEINLMLQSIGIENVNELTKEQFFEIMTSK